jgi:hypothetical protein
MNLSGIIRHPSTLKKEQCAMSEKRQHIVNEALANQRLEGLEVSKEAQDAAQLWVKGKISVDEVIRIIRENYVRRAE